MRLGEQIQEGEKAFIIMLNLLQDLEPIARATFIEQLLEFVLETN